jgi:hypothetical protein
MTSEERSTWVSALAATGTYVAYVIVMNVRAAGGPLVDVPYVRPLLWTVGATIVASIVGSIIAAILAAIVTAVRNGPEAVNEIDRKDERDKQISRFGEYVGFYVLSAGIVGALALTMTGSAHFWIANALYLAFVVSGLVTAVVKIVVYRRGF